MPDLSPQFSLFPRPQFPGSARGFHGPLPEARHPDAQNPHNVFVRFGDWPENERSMNHAFGGYEEGVSVYDMAGPHANPVDPDPHESRYEHDVGWQREMHIDTHGNDDDFEPDDTFARDNDTGEEMRGRVREAMGEAREGQTWVHHDDQNPGRRGHFVRGSLVGFGHDDEPLLNDVQHVGAWPQHAHRFVPGTDGELIRRINDRQTKKPTWTRGF